MRRKPRSLNHPDDVFFADVQRPLDGDAIATASNLRPSPFLFEDHRRLCNAVLDSKVDVLRSLLVDSGLDANARSSTGATAGHQVGRAWLQQISIVYILPSIHRRDHTCRAQVYSTARRNDTQRQYLLPVTENIQLMRDTSIIHTLLCSCVLDTSSM